MNSSKRWIRHNVRFCIVVVSLLVVSTILIYAVLHQGLRIRLAYIDATRAMTSHQALQLQMNYPVHKFAAQKLEITPRVDASVAVNGSSIVVQFQQKLRYSTTYTVTLHDIKSTHGGSFVGTVQYSFTTPSEHFYYIKRNEENTLGFYSMTSDKLIYAGGRDDKEVFQAPHIEEYIVFGKSIIAATSSSDHKTYKLKQISTQDGAVADIVTPRFDTIHKLRSAGDGTRYGFIGTTMSDKKLLQSNLYLCNTATHEKKVVKDPDGKPMQIYDWQYVLGGNAIVVSSNDTFFLIFITQEESTIQPLGQMAPLNGVSYDGQKILVTYLNKGREVIDIRSGKRTSLNDVTLQAYSPVLKFLRNSPGFVAEISPDIASGSRTAIARSMNAGYKLQTLHHTKSPDYTTYLDTSPNDQYVVIGQTNFAKSIKKTIIVDTQNGAVWRELDGDTVTWL